MNRCAFALALLLASAATHATDIRILAVAPIQPVLSELMPSFEAQTGHHVVFETLSADEAVERARKDSSADVVIVPSAQMAALAKARRILPDTRRTLGRLPEDGSVVAIAAIANGEHEDGARSLSAYLSLPETIAALRRKGLSAP